MNRYKFDWVNAGIEFDAPKIDAGLDLEILDYMGKQPEDMKEQKRYIVEFIETIYQVFSRVDKNVTRDMIKNNLSVRELGELIFALRTQNNIISKCPFCEHNLGYNDIFMVKDKKDFPSTQSKKDSTVMKKEN